MAFPPRPRYTTKAAAPRPAPRAARRKYPPVLTAGGKVWLGLLAFAAVGGFSLIAYAGVAASMDRRKKAGEQLLPVPVPLRVDRNGEAAFVEEPPVVNLEPAPAPKRRGPTERFRGRLVIQASSEWADWQARRAFDGVEATSVVCPTKSRMKIIGSK